MAKKKNSAFSNAQAAVMKAFHDLERAIGLGTEPAPKKTKAKKKAAKKKTKTRAR